MHCLGQRIYPAAYETYLEWHRTVVEQVRSNYFYRVVPSASLPSVLEPIPFSSPPPAVARRRRPRTENGEGGGHANLGSSTVVREAPRVRVPARRPKKRVQIMLSPPGAQYQYRTRSRSAATGAANLQSDLS